MKTILLVKHSVPEIVPAVPAKEWKLSKAGQIRCATLAEKLEPFLPDVFLSSTEPKAIETVQIVAGKFGKTFRTVPGLHEHSRTNIGWLEKEQFESKVKEFFDAPERLVFGEETADQALARFSQAISSIESEYPNNNILVAAHGTVITLFVKQYNAIEPFPFWKHLDFTSFAVLSLPSHELVKLEGVV